MCGWCKLGILGGSEGHLPIRLKKLLVVCHRHESKHANSRSAAAHHSLFPRHEAGTRRRGSQRPGLVYRAGRAGHEVTLVAYDSPDVPSDWNGQNGKPKVAWIPAAFRSNFFVPHQAVRIWRDLLAGGGVAHLHCPWTASNIQMSRVARRLGVPYIVSIHGMLDDWSMSQGGLKKRLFLSVGGRRYMRAANRLHYTAAAEREQAERWVPGSTAAVLPYLVDLAPFQSLPGQEPARAAFAALGGDEPKLLFLSRLHEQKGVHLLIEAAALLRQKGRNSNCSWPEPAAPLTKTSSANRPGGYNWKISSAFSAWSKAWKRFPSISPPTCLFCRPSMKISGWC